MRTVSELLDIARGELGSTWMLNDPPLGHREERSDRWSMPQLRGNRRLVPVGRCK